MKIRAGIGGNEYPRQPNTDTSLFHGNISGQSTSSFSFYPPSDSTTAARVFGSFTASLSEWPRPWASTVTSELRRRVWWHFSVRDSRAAEDYGIQKVCNPRSDVDLPLNVDDADLHPDMESLPPAKPGVTAMTFPLVTYEIARAVHRLAGILAGATSASPPNESVRKQIIDETRARIEMSLKQCNLVIPRHRLALRLSHLALRKADFVSRQQWFALRNGGSREEFATQENLVEAIEVLEICLQMWNDEMLKPYWWLWRADPEYHVVMLQRDLGLKEPF
ncbi:hypothetical protein SLS63_007958 [Diaporthe eres]|uniref:Xylanolytic transcriptional activator regulatory domain-containing protein n=1 Tax=Diaporthe eres TaxID=83184 RepID=A0ABR1P3X7_DIAER